MTTEKKQVGFIDLTPTWAGIMPLMIEILRNGNPQGVKEITEELMKLAKGMDAVNAEKKKDAKPHALTAEEMDRK